MIRKTGFIRVSILSYLLDVSYHVTKLLALPRDCVTRLSCGRQSGAVPKSLLHTYISTNSYMRHMRFVSVIFFIKVVKPKQKISLQIDN